MGGQVIVDSGEGRGLELSAVWNADGFIAIWAEERGFVCKEKEWTVWGSRPRVVRRMGWSRVGEGLGGGGVCLITATVHTWQSD